MGSEYFINNQELENKVRNLLPSQGGAGAGFDLSASTQIIPIIDLTESAEGSNVRADLQSALSFGSATAFDIINANPTVINNTGYFRIYGVVSIFGSGLVTFNATDGATTKILSKYEGGSGFLQSINFDYIQFFEAGESLNIESTSNSIRCTGNTRQLADINGNLVNP
jgi:hypothetical protein